jgi:hypothetical protein
MKKINTKNIQSKSNDSNAAVACSQLGEASDYFLSYNGGGVYFPDSTFDYKWFENTGSGTIIFGEVVGNGGNLHLRDYKTEQTLLTIPYTHFNFIYNSNYNNTSLELDSAYYNNDRVEVENNSNYYITIDYNFMRYTNNSINYPNQNQNFIYFTNKNQPITRPQDKYWRFIAYTP